jgi:hypothetical protein
MSPRPSFVRGTFGSVCVAVPVVTILAAACADPATSPLSSRLSPAIGAPTADVATATATLQRVAVLDQHPLLATVNGIDVTNGGYGSAIVPDPKRPGYFYLLTDRGPNYAVGNDIAFALPSFAPQIGHYRLDRDTLRRVGVIQLRNNAGVLLSGLPNPLGMGGTGEIAYDVNGNLLGTSIDGIDSEGLVATGDGFWVSDEYGPAIARFDVTGKQMERISPFSTGRKLPLVLAARRPNRGMEGLTLLPGTTKLVGAMQSPLDNPRAAGRASNLIRMVTFDTRTGETRQFVYVSDMPSALVSEVAGLTDNSFLVLERDGNYPGNSSAPSTLKRIYKVTIGAASNVTDPANGATGKLFNGKTLEQLTGADLAANNVVPLQKTLVADLLTLGYPHDKAEGLAVIDTRTIAVSNDDDFGVTDNGAGGFMQKILPATGKVDANDVYFIRVPRLLK